MRSSQGRASSMRKSEGSSARSGGSRRSDGPSSPRKDPKDGALQYDQEAMDDAELLDKIARSRDSRASRGPRGVKPGGKESITKDGRNALDFVPEEFLYNQHAKPILHFLPKMVKEAHIMRDEAMGIRRNAAKQQDYEDLFHDDTAEVDLIPLDALLEAAQEDVRLHRARIKAGIERDNRLVRTYQLEQDPAYKERQDRLEARESMVKELETAAPTIIKELEESAEARGMTQSERTQVQLQRWQRALEFYVHSSQHEASKDSGASSSGAPSVESSLDWQSIFEKLLDGISEDQDISQVLSQASEMCSTLVDSTKQFVIDAADHVVDLESSYLIRLEAHRLFTRGCMRHVNEIEEQFKSSGRAALQIGHQLEHAELKRSQCEAASTLIRRWWMLENLAEQEASSGKLIEVAREVRGEVAPNSCRLDPLFTQPENSLDAATALKSLRAVVRSRGNAAATGNASGTAGMGDKASSRRFDLTASLIARTSDALEQRLLNMFAEVYASGGTYDFSTKPRPGSIDWRELRALSQALLLFDSGRALHKTYVDMVVSTRFPELFSPKDKDGVESEEEDKDDSNNSGGGSDFDMDATRSKLSTLFHRVSDVCTAEFELIAHVFGSEGSRTDLLDGSEEMPLVVARALLQRVVSDPAHGLQARINDLLASIDRQGDFEAGAKKLDTFVVIHEKAAGLFSLLEDAAETMIPEEDPSDPISVRAVAAARNAAESLKGFLRSQELALSNTHRQGYINLELRLLHHDCCNSLDQAGCTLVKGPAPRPNESLAEKGILEEYRAPVLPLHKESLKEDGLTGILAGPLKQSVLRQPLIHATDSLSRARLMFGTDKRGGETTARVILSIYSQMCSFYGEGLLYPIVETLREMLPSGAPSQPPSLPFDEELEAHDLGVPPPFWVALERVHSASKSFDRELWAENRKDSHRVWETLQECGDSASLAIAKEERSHFYAELERRGESAILQALDTLSAHIQWILVMGGESMLATGGTRIFNQLTGQSGGPYAIPTGSSLETPNSPAVKSLTYCLRVHFVHVQAALTAQSLAGFWTALSMRLYDILVARLLQHYYVSTVGAVILSRDVEALRSVAMLAGSDHSHWDTLRELLTLYMTPPDAIKAMLTGPDGDASRGLFAKAGKDQCLVFMSRRNDYRYKTAAGLKKSGWVMELLSDLNITDPTDGRVNIALYAAGRNM